jgi:hypothetical protein
VIAYTGPLKSGADRNRLQVTWTFILLNELIKYGTKDSSINSGTCLYNALYIQRFIYASNQSSENVTRFKYLEVTIT